MNSGSFKNVIYKIYLEIIYLIYMYKNNLALKNLEWLIWQNQTKSNYTQDTRVKSAEAIEYIDCISAEGQGFRNAYPGYDTK